MKTAEQVEECSNCGQPGRTWPTPFNQALCVACWEEWFNDKEKEPARWVLQCKCGEIVIGREIEAACSCGRVYATFQVY